jgi:uncharacterized SAM-binding protein YcdF (DUF218 family)
MLKALAHPLPVALVIQLCALTLYWIKVRPRRPAVGVVFIIVILLTVISLPVVGELLVGSLSLPVAPDLTPDYIVVLTGGSDEGASPDLDVLSAETTKRVLFGIRYWRAHSSARIIMTGSSQGVNPAREVELMTEVARCRGVPEASIILEPRAMNTREHPVRLRAMGLAPASRLAIVTSPWHERRAIAEFRRYFLVAIPQPVPNAREPNVTDWIPDAWGLLQSTEATQEWAGIIWYRILRFLGS